MLGSHLVPVKMELRSSYRNSALFLDGAGEGKAWTCLKEVMEKSTSGSLSVCRSVAASCETVCLDVGVCECTPGSRLPPHPVLCWLETASDPSVSNTPVSWVCMRASFVKHVWTMEVSSISERCMRHLQKHAAHRSICLCS